MPRSAPGWWRGNAGGSPAMWLVLARESRIGASDARFVLISRSRFRTATQNDRPVNSRRDFSVNPSWVCALRVAFVLRATERDSNSASRAISITYGNRQREIWYEEGCERGGLWPHSSPCIPFTHHFLWFILGPVIFFSVDQERN